MAYVLTNGLARFTFIDHATTGAQLYSFELSGTGQIWLNSQTALWNANVYDTTTAPTSTVAALTPQAAYLTSASASSDAEGQILTFVWSNIPMSAGADRLNVVVTCRLNDNEDFLRTEIEATWAVGTRFTLVDIGPLPVKVDPLNEGQDFAVGPYVDGILQQDPITHFRYNPGGGRADTGFNGQLTNRCTYPSGRGCPMAGPFGYYDSQTRLGWMIWLEGLTGEKVYITYESDGTRMLWDAEQPQPNFVLAGNAGSSLGSGYTFCLRPMQFVSAHPWAEMGMHYRDRLEARDELPPAKPDDDDLSDAERAEAPFFEFQAIDTSHAPSDGRPGDISGLIDSVMTGAGFPAGTPAHGIIEAPTYNIHETAEAEDGDLHEKLRDLYAEGDRFFGTWAPQETAFWGRLWPLGTRDIVLGDGADKRFPVTVDYEGRMRMSRAGYLAGGGTDRLAEQGNGNYNRKRSYPVVSWSAGTLTATVTGTPSADGFTGTLTAVLLPASGSALMADATVQTMGASSIQVTAAFTDVNGVTATPAGGDVIVVFKSQTSDGLNTDCFHVVVNSSYFDRVKVGYASGLQDAIGACGMYLDTFTEPVLQSALSGRTFCCRDHTAYGLINPGYVNHPLGGGAWHEEALQDFVDGLRDSLRAKQVAAGRDPFCQVSAEDMHDLMMGRVAWNWHIASSGNLWRVQEVASVDVPEATHKARTIPLKQIVYAGRWRERALNNELSSALLDTGFVGHNDASLIATSGYWLAYEWPYGSLFPTLGFFTDDTIDFQDWYDNTNYVSGGGTTDNKVKSLRDLWKQINYAEITWLLDAGFRYGRMLPPADVNFAATAYTSGFSRSTWTAGAPDYHSYSTIYWKDQTPRVIHAIWQASNGNVLVVCVNWTDTAGGFSGVLPLSLMGLGEAGSIAASRIVVRRLDYTGAESGTAQFDAVTGTLTLSSVAAFTVEVVEFTAPAGGGSSMATIVKGSTFSSTVTAGGLHALVESATISGVERSALRSSEISVATLSTAELSNPADNEVWQTSPGNQLVSFDDATDTYQGGLPQIIPYTLSSSSAAVVAGNALMPSGSVFVGLDDKQDLTLATGTGTGKVLAIALAACAPGGTSVAVIAGPVRVKTTGTVNVGEALVLSSTNGVLQSAGAVGSGQGWQVIATATTAASGGLCWANLRR